MTYVSRKTRIIVSRWSDECDAEYTLRACRKRSDGRLKRHASCDDFRAWINDNCVKHDHLVDLMSDGEFLGKPPFRLYGRFIPVPILFKILQKTKISNNEKPEKKESSVRNAKSETRCEQYHDNTANSLKRLGSKGIQVKRSSSDSGSQDSKVEANESFTRLQWENSRLERRLCECTCLLNKAVGQLEKIDYIVGFGRGENCGNSENVRDKNIQEAFYKSKVACKCWARKNNLDNFSTSKSYVRKLKDSAKYSELMRKISGLKEKLKKIQDCCQDINHQIRASQLRAEVCASSSQIIELYSHREQLQKKYEKLIAEKGRLLSEMYHTQNRLNCLKKSSKSSSCFSKRSKQFRNCQNCYNGGAKGTANCSCGCLCSNAYESTDSNRIRCSDSSSKESDLNHCLNNSTKTDSNFNNDFERDAQINCGKGYEFRTGEDNDSPDSELMSGDENDCKYYSDTHKNNQRYSDFNTASASETVNLARQRVTRSPQKGLNSSDENLKDNKSKIIKKSKVKFICPESSCKRKIYSDDLSAYEDSLSPTQQALILGAIKNIQNRRPSTTPTTKREKNLYPCEQSRGGAHCFPRCSQSRYIPERQIKSETTMKEIEKTLRNYEQRLNNLYSLENKVDELKQKSSEASRLKECLEKMRIENKKHKAVEREKSKREITKLCSENWELKKQVQQLTAKSEAQSKQIQNFISGMMKARELECEAEELKKELSEYRNRYEHQRKCISKWEKFVARQRTEIENLMNYIRNMTTMKEAMSNPYIFKKYTQRSRSYSPEAKSRGTIGRSKPSKRNYRQMSEDEDVPCNCEDYFEEDNRRRIQQRSPDRSYDSPAHPRLMEWCN